MELIYLQQNYSLENPVVLNHIINFIFKKSF